MAAREYIHLACGHRIYRHTAIINAAIFVRKFGTIDVWCANCKAWQHIDTISVNQPDTPLF